MGGGVACRTSRNRRRCCLASTLRRRAPFGHWHYTAPLDVAILQRESPRNRVSKSYKCLCTALALSPSPRPSGIVAAPKSPAAGPLAPAGLFVLPGGSMARGRKGFAATLSVTLVVVSGLLATVGSVAAATSRTTLAGSKPTWASSATFVRAADPKANVGFRVYLGWRDAAGATALARAV